MRLKDLIAKSDGIHQSITEILEHFHTEGPTSQEHLETRSYIKKFHLQIFEIYEKRLISILGLFYKTTKPESLLEEIYSIYAAAIKDETGKLFTPVQADAYKNIQNKIYFSFSAPTSAGKSYLFRELIKDCTGDIIIVVPSRALIAEYLKVIKSQILQNNKDVLVLQFIEDINRDKTKRRVYVVTPERGKDLFKNLKNFNIELVLFDEAQISEENIRGLNFDAFVRRVDRNLPTAKKVFTHPFIDNPEAQLVKHNFIKNASSKRYDQNAVGKIFMSYSGQKFSFFSPYQETTKSHRVEHLRDEVENLLLNNGNILIYISKAKIYSGEYLLLFKKYIDLCPKITDRKAVRIISELRSYIGASKYKSRKHSLMIDLIEKGIVIHHGSIPLKARLLIEDFVNQNFARICFATSTLIQGINMPFDVVWIDNFRFEGTEDQRNLNLKNLIGRAGRTTSLKNSFDFGYVIIKESSISKFCSRMKSKAKLQPTSLLESKLADIPDDQKDLVNAIKSESFDDELNITQEQIVRLQKANIDNDVKLILDSLIVDKRALKASEYYLLPIGKRNKIKEAFKSIFLSHLRKDVLTKAEQTILSTSIPILLWQIQGKSFREIVSLRLAYLSQEKERIKIDSDLKKKKITLEEAKSLKRQLFIKRSTVATSLPDSTAKNVVLFKEDTHVSKIQYDLVVFDTYDYIDKVISLSLSDPISAAFQLYYEKTSDERALYMSNFIKYGTNDIVEIWLLKYGFSFEEIEQVRNYVISIDENKIIFNPFVRQLNRKLRAIVDRYI